MSASPVLNIQKVSSNSIIANNGKVSSYSGKNAKNRKIDKSKIKKKSKKKVKNKSFKRYKKSNVLVYERSPDEIKEKNQGESFKSRFMCQLDKWHNSLRGCSVTGEDALDDILYCLFLCYISPKVSTEGDFDLANSEKSCYKGIVPRKVKDWITKLNIDYLIDHTAELVTEKKANSSIYKCGELMSRHPMTKQLIKNKNFINCKDKLVLSDLLKGCREFSITHNIFNKIDIIGIAWEYFNTKHGGNGGASKERGQYFTERPLMGMCCQLIESSHIEELGINDNSTLGDEFCATFGFPVYAKRFLAEKFNINIQDKNMYGVEFADRLSRFGIMNAMFSLTSFKNISTGDSFITNVTPHLDFSVHNVPFGKSMKCKNIKKKYLSEMKMNNNLPEFKKVIPIEKNGDAMLASQLVVYKTKKMGLVIIKDGEETTGVRNAKWREWFCDSCVIHKIMKIPTGAFSHTGTKTVCIYFTKHKGQKTEKIQFLEMSNTSDKITEICQVTRNDLQKNSYSWDPNVYVRDEETHNLIASSSCEWKKVGDVCDWIKSGQAVKKENRTGGDVPYYGANGHIKDSYMDKHLYDGEFILCAQDGSIGEVHLTNGKFWVSNHAHIIKEKDTIDKHYLYYLLKYFVNYTQITTGMIPKLTQEKLKSIKIPIIPLEGQIKVSQILDDLTQHRQNYMHIRDGEERRMKYYFDMMIKRYRQGNAIENLNNICEVERGKGLKRKEFVKGPYPVIGGGQTPSGKHNEYNKEANTILCSQSGSYAGFISRYPTPVWASDCFSIKPNEEIIQQSYLFYYLKNIQNKIYKLQTGAGQPHVYPKDINNIAIPIISLEIQTQIVAKLDELVDKKNEINESIRQLDTEMREILSQCYQ